MMKKHRTPGITLLSLLIALSIVAASAATVTERSAAPAQLARAAKTLDGYRLLWEDEASQGMLPAALAPFGVAPDAQYFPTYQGRHVLGIFDPLVHQGFFPRYLDAETEEAFEPEGGVYLLVRYDAKNMIDGLQSVSRDAFLRVAQAAIGGEASRPPDAAQTGSPAPAHARLNVERMIEPGMHAAPGDTVVIRYILRNVGTLPVYGLTIADPQIHEQPLTLHALDVGQDAELHAQFVMGDAPVETHAVLQYRYTVEGRPQESRSVQMDPPVSLAPDRGNAS